MPLDESDLDDLSEEEEELLQSLNFDSILGPFLDAADDFLDDEGRAYAQNIAENLSDSAIPQRNLLEARVAVRPTRSQLYGSIDMDLKPQNERNIEASFAAHLKALQRRVAGEVGIQQRSRAFMKLEQEKPPVILKLHQYAEGNHPNLADHPHSTSLSIPIPKGYEDIAPKAAQLMKMTKEEQLAELQKLKESFKSKGIVPP